MRPKSMQAEILDKPPLSGDFEEHNFALSGDTVWVKFLDNEYLEWVGVFSLSEWKAHNSVYRVPGEDLFLVVAGGQGYFVNPNTRKITAKTEWDNIDAIIYNEKTEIFVVSDGCCLSLFKKEQVVWSSDRISADGISFVAQNGSIIEGRLNDLTSEWTKFTFDIETKSIEASWLFNENWS